MSKRILNDNFRKFVEFHKNKKEFITFAVIGSVVRPEIKKFNDVDCLILTEKRINKQLLLHKTLNHFAFYYNGKSDDIFIYNFNELKISCFYVSQKSFINHVGKILNGQFAEVQLKPWVVGGKIEEVLLGDIKLSDIFFDKTRELTKIKSLLAIYPESFRNKLLNNFSNQIKSKIELQDKIISNDFLFNLGLHEIIILLIRFIYVQQREYLLPLKHIAAGAHSRHLAEKYKKMIGRLLKLPNLKNKKEILNLLKRYINALSL